MNTKKKYMKKIFNLNQGLALFRERLGVERKMKIGEKECKPEGNEKKENPRTF